MADSLKSVDDSLYNDDSTYAAGGGAYSYDQDSQWLYNDNRALAGDQSDAPPTDAGAAASAPPASGEPPAEAAAAAAPEPSRLPSHPGTKDEGKLFVGGLSWETDETRLHGYFSKYGQIIECSIMRDQSTGRPRGFGFVTFDSVSGVNAVLQEPTHMLDGKQIDPKHAIPRESQPSQNRQSSYGQQQQQQQAGSGGGGGVPGGNNDSFVDPIKEMKGEKIFVGGLPPSAADADLNSSFAMFGNIVETKLMMDRETGRSRGYGFLQFDNEESALEAVKIGNSGDGIQIHGKRVDVKPAVHKKRAPMMPMGMMGGPNVYGMMGGSNMYGMMGMPGYGMMGMPGYGMMGMAGNGAGQEGADASNADYANAMQYNNYYGGMPGYYGAANGQGDGTGAANGAEGAYGQMGMPMGFYGATPGQGDGSGMNQYDQQGSGNNGSSTAGDRGKSDSRRGSGRYSDDRSSRDRGGRDSYRSSSRRHGGDSRSGHERSRGDHGGSSRSRDDHRGYRGSRSGRDREGPVRGASSQQSTSSRNHGHNPY
ncbi:hypothetical protein GGF46_005386 [Coemansia sp. RSA 552]|nr:hypothetical protein GGF46_005386 [Coemansia sp. RSA 552]